MKDIFDLIGRILLATTFLLAAYQYIADFQEAKEAIVANGITFRPSLLLRGSIFCLILGGLLVLFGYRAKLGAALLLAFMIPVTAIFYTDNFSDPLEQTMFVKNVAIIGGLMMILVNGSGKFSVKKLLASTTS
ncbi:MAG: putative oxidoreductase [Cognaticolwellia sp.]|jgi:putative oxidoreductase